MLQWMFLCINDLPTDLQVNADLISTDRSQDPEKWLGYSGNTDGQNS